MQSDSHDIIMSAIQEYCKYNDKFEFEGNEVAAKFARSALQKLHVAAKIRRSEIIVRKAYFKQVRGGKPGRPTRVLVRKMTLE